MKYSKQVVVLLIVMTVMMQSCIKNSRYEINSVKVLATANGINYTKGHFDKSLRFLEFLLGEQITEEEKEQGLKESIKAFYIDQYQAISQVESVDKEMQQIYNCTDPMKIALLRSAMLYQIYEVNFNLPERPFMLKLMEKYVPVLAMDNNDLLVFTEQDFQAYLTILELNVKTIGNTPQFSKVEISQLRTMLTELFKNSSLAQKQNLASMSVIANYITESYRQMTSDQKNKWHEQLANQQYAQYQNNAMQGTFQKAYELQEEKQIANNTNWSVNTDTEAKKQIYLQKMRSQMNPNSASWDIMNNTMMNTHATMLNTIENFGGTANYWEVKNYDF
jgi:hypothetical protein